MSKRTDSDENTKIQGTVTIISHPTNPAEYGYGDLEVEGNVYSDNIYENTTGQGVNIEGIKINNNYITIENIIEPGNPDVNNTRFYIENGFLKSKNSTGNIIVYSPITTKGDLIVHNGSTNVRFPIGSDGDILTADSTTETGIKWAANEGGITKHIVIGNGEDYTTYIVDYYYGSFFMSVYPYNKTGSSGIFFACKNKAERYGNQLRINGNPSQITGGILYSKWDLYEELGIYKNYNNGDGAYFVNSNADYNRTSVTLSGTAWTSLGSGYNVTTGIFCISIYSDNSGPAANFLIIKNVSSYNACVKNRINSSTGTANNNINLRWTSSSGIEISKKNNNDDGIYNIINNFEDNKFSTTTFTLSGTAYTNISRTFFRFYENKSFIARIYSESISNAPMSIVMMSKNNNNNNANRVYFHSPGQTTNEKIDIKWDTNSLLSINKSGTNYDGTYRIDITLF